MLKLAVLLVAGVIIGYTIGYEQGMAGNASVKQRVLEKIGVNKVRDDHERRQQMIERLQKERQDSVESVIHRAPVPR